MIRFKMQVQCDAGGSDDQCPNTCEVLAEPLRGITHPVRYSLPKGWVATNNFGKRQHFCPECWGDS